MKNNAGVVKKIPNKWKIDHIVLIYFLKKDAKKDMYILLDNHRFQIIGTTH